MKNTISSPFCDGVAVLKSITKEEEFKKEKFIVYEFFYKCEKTGKEFTTPEIVNINMFQLFNQYRERKNILFPEQIKNMREKYGLSASKMSEVLGFGANTISNYEKGEIPNDSNATLLSIANEPEEFKKIIEKKEKLFSDKQLKNLYNRIDKLIREEKTCNIFNILWENIALPNKYTGYKIPDFKKFAHLVMFFIKDRYTYITRLNKYLFYSDFYNFKNSGYSITGLHYVAIPNGPVPNRYNYLYNLLETEGYIERENVQFNDKITVERFKPSKKFDKTLFTEIELDSLINVFKKLQYLSTTEIIDLIHKENAWIENKDKNSIISYQDYGFELKGI